MNAVEVDNVRKRYGKTEALRGVSLDIAQGELFGLIGPDGAGKTSLLRILATLILADSGTARIGSLDVVKDYSAIRRITGYMPGRFSLYPDLSVGENLQFFASLFGTSVEENYDLIKDIYSQLEPFVTRRAANLSGGMKQKLALCCAMIHAPRILLLDEPTTGVDPVSRKEFWQMLARLKQRGVTVLVSTPYMDEASRCDRIGLINNGSLITVDTPEAVRAKYHKPLFAISADNMPGLLADARTLPDCESCFAFGNVHHLCLTDGNTTAGQIADFLSSRGNTNVSVRSVEPSIEDCFMALTLNR